MQPQNPIFIPGPTNIPDNIRNAMNVQTTDHRSGNFGELLFPVVAGLKQVFKTSAASIAVFPASGTGGWEAAISNTLSPGDKVLIPRFGVFSGRWAQMCSHYGLDVEIIECDWGTGVPTGKIAEILDADTRHTIKAVLVTHNETATGVRSDVGAVRSAMEAASHPALLFTDCVSSLGCMDFRMDEWQVDIAITGSQKGLMLPMGLAIVAVSDKAMSALDQSKNTRSFFDLRDMLKDMGDGSYPYTPPIPLIEGLRCALNMLFEEGLDQVFERHNHIAEGVRRAIAAWGLPLCAKSPDLYSDSVSTIMVPDGFNSNELTIHAYQRYRTSFGAGLGQLTGKAFRIGHLGAMPEPMALSGLATIEMAMKDLNYPIELGQGVAAAQNYYRKKAITILKKAA